MAPETRRAMLVAGLATVPALLAWAVYGPLTVFDSQAYLDYAASLRAGTIPSGVALLQQGPVPVSLYRMGGYPAILAALQGLFGTQWREVLVGLQVAAQAAVAGGSYRAGRAVGLRPGLATVAGLLPAIGFGLVVQICVLSDAFCGALLTGAALALLTRRGIAGPVMAGVALAGATCLREATVFLALAYLPLALCVPGPWRRRVCGAALVILLPWCVGSAQIGWNIRRGAGPMLTTSPQTVMVQAVLPLLRDGLPVYPGDDVFDRTARSTIVPGGYMAIDDLHRRLFAAGMTAPQIAATAKQRYVSAWQHFPAAMLSASLHTLRPSYLTMPLQPLEIVGDLSIFAKGARPDTLAPNWLWRSLRDGAPAAMLLLGTDLLAKTCGVVIAIAAILGPWMVRRAWQMRALWCVCAGFVGVYAPVHIEPRYLAPILPLIAILAAWSGVSLVRVLTGRRGAWAAPPAIGVRR